MERGEVVLKRIEGKEPLSGVMTSDLHRNTRIYTHECPSD